MPGKLLSSLLDATNSTDGKSTYRIFVFAGKSACRLNTKHKVNYSQYISQPNMQRGKNDK